MATEVMMINPMTGAKMRSFEGFSWTMLLFGTLAPLIRGDMKMALIHFVLLFCTAGISYIVLPFLWNKYHREALVKHGFIPLQQYEYSKQQEQELIKRERQEERDFMVKMKSL